MAKIQETDEANDLLEQIEEQEKNLWQLTLALNTAKLDVKEKQKAFDAGIAEMRRLARTRLEENPLFDDADEPDDCSEPPDSTVTFETANQSVTMPIGKNKKGKAVVHTADGRKITPAQMADEIAAGFKSGKY